MNASNITVDFNNTIISFVQNISDVCPTCVIAIHRKDVERLIKKPEYEFKFIETFCIKVLQYKARIDADDESFFLQKSYDDDLDNNQTLINHVFELKSIWLDLNDDNKLVVKQYMKILCALAEQYYLIICQ